MPVILIVGPYRFFFYSNEGNRVNAGFSAQELRKICKLVQEKRDILKGAYHDYFA